uniref:phosphoglycerate dehydrogenase n=1 Tax=Mantoniella antarctica TaxID=81844 RepID=A0A6U3GC24_9CHLO|mmetsp:Transcript_27202/g.68076  ORF Transcript_27202/g.68076 Transcript_27202/m.68076 type:complete len:514 (+) Transcript_27202:139-1680(+)|eukprot:CAMPEP_0181362060 /NCGR_PEP_ID=MMETSP1106-20121128/7738_1 /TAXON_ID=81844 /ORGANISM="Mantoniella antarctica, Strain SL-175" /LENGTH=513 /DNA_ID=CAMNT_0023475855 /DNA_START=125 /DNA_END=1666 /DNA_ORIENTATION=+
MAAFAAQLSMAAPKALPAQQLRASSRSSFRAGAAPARRGAVKTVSAVASDADEIVLLEKMLKIAKERKSKEAEAPAAGGADGEYDGKGFTIKTYNAISPVGLNKYPKGKYRVSGDDAALPAPAMAVMLRSQKLQVEDIPATVRGIVRCGAGTNNIPVKEMTERGIPVFNTPGANANAVKELVVCGLLLASRGIIEGNYHVNNVINKEEGGDYEKISKRIEADKAMFGGLEIEGKTIGVIGLGAIGSKVVTAALGLGMKVIGYDPVLSLDAALQLPGDRMTRVTELDDLFEASDFITVHVPYIKGVTHHLINSEALAKCKPGVHLLNFARGEIIDGAAVRSGYDNSTLTGKYISDFSDPDLMGHPRHIVLPHLGASTEEAEENSAAMAATTMMDFLETGTIRNSVNFPTTILAPQKNSSGARLCIVNRNEPGALGEITTFLGSKGLNISQQINTSRGDIAYTVIDFTNQPEDADSLQADLAATCSFIISLRFLGMVFDDELGEPGTFFYVSWAQ